MIVVDASAVVEVLLRLPQADALTERLLGGTETLHAPHLLDVEVAQVIRRICGRHEITAQRGDVSLAILRSLPVRRYPHGPLLERVWQLRANATAYDGVYVALAEALRAPLVTRDVRLSRIPGVRTRIEVF